MVTKLYKYMSFRDEVECIFTHNEVKFNSPINFNDPFDCNIPISAEGVDDDFRNLLVEHYKATYPQASDQQIMQVIETHLSSGEHRNAVLMKQSLNEGIQNQLKSIGVYCMSAKKDNFLMWSHYANGHKGICLEYKGTESHKGICFEFREDDVTPCLKCAKEVKYVDTLPRLSIFGLMQSNRGRDRLVESEATEEAQKGSVEFLNTKLKNWAYEDEWRIIELNGPGIYQLAEGVVSGVIVGCKMSKNDERKIVSWIKKCKKAIALYRAQIKENDDCLDITRINVF